MSYERKTLRVLYFHGKSSEILCKCKGPGPSVFEYSLHFSTIKVLYETESEDRYLRSCVYSKKWSVVETFLSILHTDIAHEYVDEVTDVVRGWLPKRFYGCT